MVYIEPDWCKPNFAKISSGINGRDHLTILESHVDKIATVVQLNDNNRKLKKQDYYKLAIGSLYNDGKTPSPEFDLTFNNLLDSINKKNGFTITVDNASAMIASQRQVSVSNRAKCLL